MTLISDGFDIVEQCLTAPECRDVSSGLSTVKSAGTRKLLESRWCQELAATLRERLAPHYSVLSELVAIQCNYFHKSPKSNWLVAFHQDLSIPVAASASAKTQPGWSQKEGMTFAHGSEKLLAHMLAVRLHLDDSNDLNGPLQVVPGSHRQGILAQGDASSLRESSPEQTLNVNQGGVILMRPLLLHASSKSQTSSPRRVLHFVFAPRKPPKGLKWNLAV
ncbi:MAG: phytanoyl-CoA dioxygenase family protein [Lacipirellulaceae bacterium]